MPTPTVPQDELMTWLVCLFSTPTGLSHGYSVATATHRLSQVWPLTTTRHPYAAAQISQTYQRHQGHLFQLQHLPHPWLTVHSPTKLASLRPSGVIGISPALAQAMLDLLKPYNGRPIDAHWLWQTVQHNQDNPHGQPYVTVMTYWDLLDRGLIKEICGVIAV